MISAYRCLARAAAFGHEKQRADLADTRANTDAGRTRPRPKRPRMRQSRDSQRERPIRRQDGRPGLPRSHECRARATASCRIAPETCKLRERV
jgi:hypothetical protein